MRKNNFIKITGFVAAALLVFNAPDFAVATDGLEEDKLQELVELNPGASRDEIVESIERLADEKGESEGAVLEQALKEARFSIEGIRRDFGDADTQTRNADSGGGKLEVPLTAAEQRGDIFVSGNKTLGVVDHGHTGIYVSTEHIVEAPGLGKNSRNVLARSIKVTNDAVKQRVNTSEENRNKAADYARDHMVDKPYNVHFEDNKHVPADSYNCSQLVWGAYMAGADVDLDSNGGRAVFPYDLKDSELTETYEVLKK